MDKPFKYLIVLFIIISSAIIINFSLNKIRDLSDPLKENIITGNISKEKALEIGCDYLKDAKIYAYEVNQVFINTTLLDGTSICNYVWDVNIYVTPLYVRNKIFYSILIDIETGERLQVIKVVGIP